MKTHNDELRLLPNLGKVLVSMLTVKLKDKNLRKIKKLIDKV